MPCQFEKRESVNESLHDYLLRLFRYYLIVGGMPEAVNQFVHDQNVAKVRAIQQDIIELYRVDASQYDEEQKLKIRTIYDLIPSILENTALLRSSSILCPGFCRRCSASRNRQGN